MQLLHSRIRAVISSTGGSLSLSMRQRTLHGEEGIAKLVSEKLMEGGALQGGDKNHEMIPMVHQGRRGAQMEKRRWLTVRMRMRIPKNTANGRSESRREMREMADRDLKEGLNQVLRLHLRKGRA